MWVGLLVPVSLLLFLKIFIDELPMAVGEKPVGYVFEKAGSFGFLDFSERFTDTDD